MKPVHAGQEPQFLVALEIHETNRAPLIVLCQLFPTLKLDDTKLVDLELLETLLVPLVLLRSLVLQEPRVVVHHQRLSDHHLLHLVFLHVLLEVFRLKVLRAQLTRNQEVLFLIKRQSAVQRILSLILFRNHKGRLFSCILFRNHLRAHFSQILFGNHLGGHRSRWLLIQGIGLFGEGLGLIRHLLYLLDNRFRSALKRILFSLVSNPEFLRQGLHLLFS